MDDLTYPDRKCQQLKAACRYTSLSRAISRTIPAFLSSSHCCAAYPSLPPPSRCDMTVGCKRPDHNFTADWEFFLYQSHISSSLCREKTEFHTDNSSACITAPTTLPLSMLEMPVCHILLMSDNARVMTTTERCRQT